MRNRDLIVNKLDRVESNLTTLNRLINIGDKDSCKNIISNTKETIIQIQDWIEKEPRTGEEYKL